jgi:hypothetical protein
MNSSPEARRVRRSRPVKADTVPFEIHIHDADNIIEVVYPPQPTAADVATYVEKIRAVIVIRHAPWRCLVDQRALQVLPPELLEELAALNRFAGEHGMERAARVVSTAVSTLQAMRLAREAQVKVPIRTFTQRDDALAWLRERR